MKDEATGRDAREASPPEPEASGAEAPPSPEPEKPEPEAELRADADIPGKEGPADSADASVPREPESTPDDAPAPSEGDDAAAREAPSEKGEPGAASSPTPSPSPLPAWRRWAFAVVPAVALLALVAHVRQTTDVVPESDWVAAREVVKKTIKSEDLLLFAPKWEDPIGRAIFGDELASLERTARPDESRFPRAIEVSARGKHRPELAGWKLTNEERVGKLVVGTYENPAPVKLLDDLRLFVSPEKMAVFRVDGAKESPCSFVRGRPQAGGLGAGPAVPGDRFQCEGGSFVGASIIHALDHDPKACLFAPPFGPNVVLRVKFKNVRFGRALHGHHGLQNEAERDKTGAPVSITFRTERGLLGRAEHKDGMGWTGFELDTQELSGRTTDLVADITAGNANRRHYCFEADTR